MNQQGFQDQIQDYLDGLLEGETLREFEEYLLAHPEARDTLAAVRQFLDRVAAHPLELQPGRDLWPGIVRAIREPVVEHSGRVDSARERPAPRVERVWQRPRSRWFARPAAWGGLAAAAALAVALVVLVPGALERGREAPGLAVRETGAPVWPAMVRALEAECVAADVQLATTLGEGHEAISPSTLHRLRADIRVLDAAVMSLQRALAENPDDSMLTMQLLKTYERKLSVLKQVERAARRV